MSLIDVMFVTDLRPGMRFSIDKEENPCDEWILKRLPKDGEMFQGIRISNDLRNKWVVSPIGGDTEVLACFDLIFNPKRYNFKPATQDEP
jgi:hypothetical protein